METVRLWEDSIAYNWAYQNNVVTACGLHRYYKQTGDETFKTHAQKAVDLLIKTDSMIMEGPLKYAIRTVYDDDPMPFRKESNWKAGDLYQLDALPDADALRLTPMDKDYNGHNAPIIEKNGTWFIDLICSVNTAVTGYYLLEYSDIADYQPAAEFAEKMGLFFLNHQEKDGSWSRFYNPRSDFWDWAEKHGHTELLKRQIAKNKNQCSDGLVVWFLTRLYEKTGKDKFLEAAVKGMQHLYDKHISRNIYYGTEYHAWFAEAGLMDSKAPFVCFLAGMELYKVTGQDEYRQWAEIAGDFMRLFVYVYDNPDLTENHKHGWTDCTAAPEGIDHRGGWFAEHLMKYYALTGNRQYFTDAIGMIRSWSQGQVLADLPFIKYSASKDQIDPEVYGSFPESHNGGGWGMGIIDVGEGCTHFLATLAEVVEKYGGLYVNTEYGDAFGIDGVDIIESIVSDSKAHLTFRNVCSETHTIEVQTDRKIARVEFDGRPWKRFSESRIYDISISGTGMLNIIFETGQSEAASISKSK